MRKPLSRWFATCALVALAAAAPARADIAGQVAAIVDPLVESSLEESGAPGAAFVFVHGGRIAYARGYGLADIERRDPVDAARTVWPIASITKAVTAMAVLQLVDSGDVDLDTDVNRYLKRLQVPSGAYPPLTLRHLLSHTGGLDELPGRQFDGRDGQDLATFLRERLVRYRAPGALTAYSTYGILLAALVLEDASARDFDTYLRENLFGPAGMATARVMNQRGDERGVATPYAIEDGRAEAMPYEWYRSTPTSSVVASAEDMGRLLLVHLAGGRAGTKRVLSERLTLAMHTQEATLHQDIPGWSLGMQMDEVNGRTIAEHGGDIGGFSALLVVIPEEDAGFFLVNHGEGSDLRFAVKDALIERLYPAKAPPVVPTPRPADAARLSEYAGNYLSSIACRSCPRDPGSVFELRATPDGTLSLWGQRWIPLPERDLFVRDDGKRKLGFARDAAGRVAAVSAGSWRVADRLP
jgi:CubicO group peptidase (beta-lactamase class C family)